jgi:hypothetical protein
MAKSAGMKIWRPPRLSIDPPSHGLGRLPIRSRGSRPSEFSSQFRDDKTMTDLSRWHVFESENPNTFFGMYQFWVQKAY